MTWGVFFCEGKEKGCVVEGREVIKSFLLTYFFGLTQKSTKKSQACPADQRGLIMSAPKIAA